MQDFIKSVVSQLGADEGAAKAATGGLLGLIKQHADPADATAVLDKLPGARALLGAAPQAASSGGGLLGSITAGLGGALGGGAASALGAVQALSQGGLSADKLSGFLSLFQKYAKPLLGDALLGRVLAKVPGLGKLLG